MSAAYTAGGPQTPDQFAANLRQQAAGFKSNAGFGFQPDPNAEALIAQAAAQYAAWYATSGYGIGAPIPMDQTAAQFFQGAPNKTIALDGSIITILPPAPVAALPNQTNQQTVPDGSVPVNKTPSTMTGGSVASGATPITQQQAQTILPGTPAAKNAPDYSPTSDATKTAPVAIMSGPGATGLNPGNYISAAQLTNIAGGVPTLNGDQWCYYLSKAIPGYSCPAVDVILKNNVNVTADRFLQTVRDYYGGASASGSPGIQQAGFGNVGQTFTDAVKNPTQHPYVWGIIIVGALFLAFQHHLIPKKIL
jgi:hypothetical protein